MDGQVRWQLGGKMLIEAPRLQHGPQRNVVFDRSNACFRNQVGLINHGVFVAITWKHPRFFRGYRRCDLSFGDMFDSETFILITP